MSADTSTSISTTFAVAAIPASTLARIRDAGVDDLGHELVVTRAGGGEPLRCCLRDADPGERIGLIAYGPFPWDGVYAEVGPVFVHADDCGGYPEPGSYPAGFRYRQQIFRAYGHDRTIVDARIVKGVDAEEAIAELLARPEVDFVHSRNVPYSCFMFAVQRAQRSGRSQHSG